MSKAGRPRKKRLIDQIPRNLNKAIRWIHKIKDDYEKRMQHTPGPDSQKEKQEIIEAWDEIDRRIAERNKKVKKEQEEKEYKRKVEQARRERYPKLTEAERKKREERQERYMQRKIEGDDPDFWQRW